MILSRVNLIRFTLHLRMYYILYYICINNESEFVCSSEAEQNGRSVAIDVRFSSPDYRPITKVRRSRLPCSNANDVVIQLE